ncbi:NAD(P)/FAD-dependent oxidoreductase [Paraburkholderia sp. 31.1]|uniref:NAD(P)/FAD-dependent oxidoreductase n=1 Tax=Paraburkholderia sp. 31.1 TaxID=2615205 RepID=UPI001CA3DFE1|nr:FAD-dependent oxidoreductase [Paraburkholderia sp. 31.1]
MIRENHDVVIVGGGVVGCALAHGMLGRGKRALVLDGGDCDPRASKANFGLVGAYGKGYGAPRYQQLSRESVALWSAFATALHDETGIDVEYENDGCLRFCLSEADFEEEAAFLASWNAQSPKIDPCSRMIDRSVLERLLPGTRLGREVVGAGIGVADGHCNPLKLLRALQQAIELRGGTLAGNHTVSKIEPCPDGSFRVHVQTSTGPRCFETGQLIIAAGLGSTALGAMVALDVPLRPLRGQLLVTERLDPILRLPASGIRQTRDGTVMIGVSHEEVGMDLGTTTFTAAKMTKRALRILPDLAMARLVRHWACLRIITPDEHPVYAQSSTYPGAWIALCHSGITLAAVHAGPVADALARNVLPENFEFFHHRRFDVSQVI